MNKLIGAEQEAAKWLEDRGLTLKVWMEGNKPGMCPNGAEVLAQFRKWLEDGRPQTAEQSPISALPPLYCPGVRDLQRARHGAGEYAWAKPYNRVRAKQST